MVPAHEIQERVKRLQAHLKKVDCELAVIIQKAALYYFSHCDQDAHLFIPAEGEPFLLVRKSMVRALEDSRIPNMGAITNFVDIKEKVLEFYGREPKTLGLEMDVLPVRYYLAYQKVFKGTRILDITGPIREVRMVKSAYELGRIQMASRLGDEMLAHVPQVLLRQDTLTETDLAAALEYFYRKRGHMGLLRTRAFNSECFYGHVLAGRAGAMPSNAPGPTAGTGVGPYFSQGAGANPINENEPIVVDYTSNQEGYVSDQARTYAMGGLPSLLLDAHRLMMEVEDLIMEEARPGVICEDLYERVKAFVSSTRFLRGFMGYPDPVPFVAHGVGLELDELPVVGRGSRIALEEGMVLAVEPKVILPEYGAVGLENTVVVEEKGLRRLNRFPREVIIV